MLLTNIFHAQSCIKRQSKDSRILIHLMKTAYLLMDIECYPRVRRVACAATPVTSATPMSWSHTKAFCPRTTASHKRDSEIAYVNVPGAPSQPASNDDARVPAIVVASQE